MAAVASQKVTAGEALNFQLLAVDPNTPPSEIRYAALGTPPSGMMVNATSGAVCWDVPPSWSAGEQRVQFQAASVSGDVGSAQQEISITVLKPPPLQPPRLVAVAAQTVEAGQRLTFAITALDPNTPPGQLSYSLQAPFPAGALLDQQTGHFTWQVPPSQTADTLTIRYTVRTSLPAAPTADGTVTIRITSPPPPVVPSFAGTRAGEEWDGNGLKMKFCWCPPGKFTMG